MKHLKNILLFPETAEERYRLPHHIWLSVCLTALGCCVGVLTLLLGAMAYLKLDNGQLFLSYLRHPLLLGMNLLLPVLLAWLFYFLSGRAWVGFLGSAIPCTLIALVNYYKIRLRGDPLLGADLLLVSEAGGIVGQYTLDVTWVVWTAGACVVLGLVFAIFLMPRGIKGWKGRVIGTVVCLALVAGSFFGLFTSKTIYNKTANTQHINPWSDVEVFVSRGVLYPFLYSVQDMIPTPPEGYDKGAAKTALESCPNRDIPAGERVDVVAIMLEAFCDLTDFPALAGQEGVQGVYAPWHALEEQSVSGDLLTNIFSGGTVDSEWSFLTGYTQFDQFRSATDSYVWYFRDQGYTTAFHHPGHSWFYNRQNVNQYLGFEESFFTDNRYGQYVDPVTAVYHSDNILVDQVLSDLEGQTAPSFTFSVTYQNHGPYETGPGAEPRVTPAGCGLSEESCNIINSYLGGVAETIAAMERMLGELEEREKPTVVVLFGDHKPWMGNADSVYTEMGANFDLSTREGFETYYGTPYLIWANSAAKGMLENSFTGDGGDFSPCFLMPRLFDLCGWEGPGFMQLARQMRDISPLVHTRGLFLEGDALTDTLSGADQVFYRGFLAAQYYREKEIDPDE